MRHLYVSTFRKPSSMRSVLLWCRPRFHDCFIGALVVGDLDLCRRGKPAPQGDAGGKETLVLVSLPLRMMAWAMTTTLRLLFESMIKNVNKPGSMAFPIRSPFRRICETTWEPERDRMGISLPAHDPFAECAQLKRLARAM